MKAFRLLALAAIVVVSTFAACKKDQTNAQPRLQIRLTDAPVALDEVNVELKQVIVKMDRDENKWITLPTKAGVYNLLSLQNGVTALIADGTVEQGVVKEIRLVLGSQNTVVAGGKTYPLTIPSGSESGLKIKIGKQVRQNLESLLIDFDAALSVKKDQDGYKLRPVLRLK
jgi:hypothetical protein